MKLIIISAIIIGIIIVILSFQNKSKSIKTLEIGEKIPSFTLLNQDSISLSINDSIGIKNIVIYFYPKDDTPGCTKEACSFRDEFEEFGNLDALVIGISSDSPTSHKNFIKKYNLPFALLSDPENKVRNMFGVKSDLLGLIPGRVTFVVDKSGVVQYIFDSQLNSIKHVEKAKEVLEKMKQS